MQKDLNIERKFVRETPIRMGRKQASLKFK